MGYCPILLYIDPGTGSMLFAILIGIIGAVTYAVRTWFVNLKFKLSAGKSGEIAADKIPLVIFSDDKRYWTIFDPVCRELNARGIDTVYMTASQDDKGLSNDYEHVKAEFIGEGNRAFARLNMMKARILLSTTPGLDVYQWKRSKEVDYYIHMLHASNEVAFYRMFGVDYYDAVLLSGDYQVRDLRNLEKLRNLPAKDVELVGVPYMDEMKKRLETSGKSDSASATNQGVYTDGRPVVLLAPTWGSSGILKKFGSRILDVLIETGYHIIVRPHPQSFTAEKDMMDELMSKYPATDSFEWNRDADNFEVLKRADIMISDYSGVAFDFSLVFDKPIIYADTDFDKSPYDLWWLDTPFWTLTALPRMGEKLTEDNISNLKSVIDNCINDSKYSEGREEVRNETWVHRGEGAKRVVDFIEKKMRK